ncbi:MAG: lipid-binding protein [Flavobacteriales bacterium]|nr:lipid-binding protein [Flavobacteriales bacterium]|tara:strand:- start:114 stop:743 length:630 start_codon:yes stop_codon:yes gene_type:complete
MKSIKVITLLLTLSIFSFQSFACKTCGCSSKKDSHSHGENSIKKDIDISKSTVKWVGKKVTGSHEGNISIKEGHIHFDDNAFTGGNIVIDMSTIECTDLDGDSKQNIENHLSSDDFFGVKKYPTANLEVISAEKVKYSKNKYRVKGILEIKNIKNDVEFEVVIDNSLAKVELVIDRTKYDIKYGSGSFFDNLGDKMIYDDFNLSVSLTY